MKIWEYNNYRDYLEDKLGSEGTRTGLRKQLAEYIPVHTTFVSQVLKNKAQFSLEQAEAINTFLDHSEDEGEFFLLLLLKDRAGNIKLKNRFENKIKQMRELHFNIKKRLKSSDDISQEDREKFYSSSIYGAIHVLASIPSYQNINALSEITRIPKNRIREIVDFLIYIKILNEVEDKITSTTNHVHLDNDSELILKHHSNWRQHTLNSLQFLDKDSLHYSACMSLSAADAVKVKESILENLKKNIDIVGKSKEETAFVLCLDFFKLFN
jgi:uncharacterized protein (TIGR02147 family)